MKAEEVYEQTDEEAKRLLSLSFLGIKLKLTGLSYCFNSPVYGYCAFGDFMLEMSRDVKTVNYEDTA